MYLKRTCSICNVTLLVNLAHLGYVIGCAKCGTPYRIQSDLALKTLRQEDVEEVGKHPEWVNAFVENLEWCANRGNTA